MDKERHEKAASVAYRIRRFVHATLEVGEARFGAYVGDRQKLVDATKADLEEAENELIASIERAIS